MLEFVTCSRNVPTHYLVTTYRIAMANRVIKVKHVDMQFLNYVLTRKI